MIDRFSWRSYDLRTHLPANWQTELLEAAATKAQSKVLKPKSVTSRESDEELGIHVMTVGGVTLRESCPWLYDLYKGLFRDLAQLACTEPVSTASNDTYGAVLNVQRGQNMRYECHVDSNPIEGLLYVTTHVPGTGGELVVANRPDARSVEDVEQDCSVVYPIAGNLVFFDARRFSHYVRPLASEHDLRVVVAMNFYTPSCSEADRPTDLTPHLFGEALPGGGVDSSTASPS